MQLRVVLVALALALLATAAAAHLPAPGTPGAPTDVRFCGEPQRYADGTIKRSRAVLDRFAAANPCPSTLSGRHGCAGWQINHIWPLATGGCDKEFNLWWFPVRIKTCVEPWCIDRWERNYTAFPRQKVVLP